MANVNLHPIVESAYGKLSEKSAISLRRRNHRSHTYAWDDSTCIVPTPARLRQRQTMKLATLAAATIVHDPLQRQLWYERFRAQQRYRNFYPFLIATQMMVIKPQLSNA